MSPEIEVGSRMRSTGARLLSATLVAAVAIGTLAASYRPAKALPAERVASLAGGASVIVPPAIVAAAVAGATAAWQVVWQAWEGDTPHRIPRKGDVEPLPPRSQLAAVLD